MRTRLLLFAALAVSLARAAELPSGTDISKNYFKNGSFEIGRDNFDYDGWQNRDATGKRALFVEKGNAVMCQNGYVDPGTYVFTVTARAKPGTDVQNAKGKPSKGLGLRYGVNYRTAKGGPEKRTDGLLLCGCAKDAVPAWERLVSEPIIVPTNVFGKAYVHIECGGFGSPQTTGIIDDVALYRVK